MKISQEGKTLIINKIRTTLIEEASERIGAAGALVNKTYVSWFRRNILPYKDSPLYPYLNWSTSDCNLHIFDHTTEIKIVEFQKPAKSTYSTVTGASLSRVSSINVKELPVGVQGLVIHVHSSSYSSPCDLRWEDLTKEERLAISNHNEQCRTAQKEINESCDHVTIALDEVNTYKQLQTALPMIYNSMPIELKEKHMAYLTKAKTRKTTKEELQTKAEQFTDLGSKLAVAALKKGVT